MKTERIGRKRYRYRGVVIQGLKYHAPDKRSVWEAYEENGHDVIVHAFSLRECKKHIDNLLTK